MRFAHPLFFVKRFVHALALILAAASAALILVHFAPLDQGDGFGDPEFIARERARLGYDRPLAVQYTDWLSRALTLDFGESTRYQRPVSALLGERIGNTLLLGVTALAVALGLGLPAGVLTAASPRAWTSRAIRAASLLLISVPPLVTSLVLLLIAARTGVLPAGGLGDGATGGLVNTLLHLPLPALALGLPVAASLERLQSRAMLEALAEPSITAARARGIPARRTTWVHAWRLSLTPVLAILGIVIGSVLSGSFVVEYVMTWPGLGRLMHDALVSRDLHLAAGCAAAGAALLALGLELTDVARQYSDPRVSAA